MRAIAAPRCPLCGSHGRKRHDGLTDTLFHATGSWSIAECPDVNCGLLWLDPMPVAADLAEAYVGYYTHHQVQEETSPGLLRRISAWAKAGYHRHQYGYDLSPNPPWSRAAHALLHLLPIRRGFADAEVRFLPSLPGGRLLDVGCGAGAWLAAMQARGWQVHGVDFDPQAVAAAQAHGLTVALGSLEAQALPSASFDAVTLNHVVEHLPDPVSTLRECHRVLRPGGQLVVSTPNAASLGHRLLGRSWRGLEPPRHLHVFNFPALESALRQAGFTRMCLHGHVSPYVINESLLTRLAHADGKRPRRLPLAWRLAGALIVGGELLLSDLRPAATDCVTAIATA